MTTSKNKYTSSDFSKVENKLQCILPSKLKHESVLDTSFSNFDEGFSNERQHNVTVVNVPSTTMSMTIGHLEPNQSTRKHRHNYETILLVIEGSGFSQIEDKKILWNRGDVIYIPVWAWHQHTSLNDEYCIYAACENAPLLQNLGNIALREEI